MLGSQERRCSDAIAQAINHAAGDKQGAREQGSVRDNFRMFLLSSCFLGEHLACFLLTLRYYHRLMRHRG